MKVIWCRLPTPAHSDRDDPVAVSLCVAVVLNVLIASENFFHRQATGVVPLGLSWSFVSGLDVGVVCVTSCRNCFVASVSTTLADLVVPPMSGIEPALVGALCWPVFVWL